MARNDELPILNFHFAKEKILITELPCELRTKHSIKVIEIMMEAS